MRVLILALAAMGAAIFLTLLVKEEPGYVLIGYDVWTLETTLAWFVLMAVMAFSLVYIGLRLFSNTLSIPKRMRAWGSQKSAKRAQNTLNKGLVELSEGQWKGAEKHLLKHAKKSDTPLLNYLAAARSAQQQGSSERRDEYLQLAHESMPQADVAVSLTQAELQIENGQLEQALATLMHLRSVAPRHTYVLSLLRTLYLQLEDWQQLYALIPELRKQKVLDEGELQGLEVSVYTGLLNQAAQETDSDKMIATWSKVPRNLRSHESLVENYAKHLMERELFGQAEALLRESLKRQWNESLIELYGRLDTAEPGKQLSAAEDWLNKKPHNAPLLLALGRLCLRCKLWGKARSYLEASIGAEPSAAAYRELGSLLEQMEEPGKAMACYRAGLELTAECAPPVLPPMEGQLLTMKEQPAAEDEAESEEAKAPEAASA